MQTVRRSVATILVLAALLLSCENGQTSQKWRLDTSQTSEDLGIDSTDTRDAFDAGDIRDAEPDAPPPPPDVDPVPDQPPKSTYCNDAGWCWLQPRPFPHRITDLRQVGDSVYGVAYDLNLPEYGQLVWDDDGMNLVQTSEDLGFVASDMTTSNDGWLVLRHDGRVYEVGIDGVRRTTTLPAESEETDFLEIEGNSLDAFIVRSEEAWHVKRGEDVTTFSNPTGHIELLKMWPGGEILTIGGVSSMATRLAGTWTLLPNVPKGPNVTAVGPRPQGACGALGLFAGTDARILSRWTSSEGWNEVSYPGAEPAAIGCSREGKLKVGDRTGRVYTADPGNSGGWETRRPFNEAVNDMLFAGSKTYVAGRVGRHAVVDGGSQTILGSGLLFPEDSYETWFRNRSIDSVWVTFGGAEMIVGTGRDFARVTASGVTHMPFSSEGLETTHPGPDKIVGGAQPWYAVSDQSLLEWTGSRWRNMTSEVLGANNNKIVDIAAESRTDVYVAAEDSFHHFNGTQWRNVTAPKGAERLNAVSMVDDRVLVGADGGIYQVDDIGGVLGLSTAMSTPCRGVNIIEETLRGSIWVAGFNCLAKYSSGTWTDYSDESLGYWGGHVDTSVASVVPRGPSRPPLIATAVGIYEPQPDGTLEPEYRGRFVGGVHVPTKNATVMFSHTGILAKYY